MYEWDPSKSIIRLIDKTNSTPTGTTDGGLVAGDLIGTNKIARLIIDRGDGKVPVATLYLELDQTNSGQFQTSAPILTDKNAFSKYLLETKIAQTVNGVTKYGKLHRFNLSTPSVVEDKDLGWVLQVPCEHIAMEMLDESFTALNQELQTPYGRVSSLLLDYQRQIDSLGTTDVLVHYQGNIDLPDDDSLKVDYFPTSPETYADAFQEVLDRLKLEGAEAGDFKNYYYWVEAHDNETMSVIIHFEEFGLHDSGVTISPTLSQQAAPLNRTVSTSNKKRRNRIIVRYHPRFGSLPGEFQRFSSTFEHAKVRPEWDATVVYKFGDTVKQTDTSQNPYILRFYTCGTAVGPSATIPPQDTDHWFEDFTIIPEWDVNAYYTVGEIVTFTDMTYVRHYKCIVAVDKGGDNPFIDGFHWSQISQRLFLGYTPFYSYTPWTADYDSFITNLCGTSTLPAGYIGFVPDWNYERQINDLVDYTDRFALVTGKAVRRVTNRPPFFNELYTGMRVLIGSAPTEVFIGHKNQIAEYFKDPNTFEEDWHYSSDPIEGDTIMIVENAEIAKFDGTDWITVWSWARADLPTPFHAVKSAHLVKSATGIPGQAIEYRFDWKDLLDGGNDVNRTSRFAGINMFYPYPISDNTSTSIGELYGGIGGLTPTNPMIDHQNTNLTRKGDAGWNLGIDNEEQGRISQHAFKVRCGFFQSSDDTLLIYGKANMTFVYWRKDLNGRFFFKDFIIPENNEFYPVNIQLPPYGPTQLYFNRLNELVQVLGYTLPFDFFIQEKEFSGVKYEWRKNQSWGILMKDSYNDTGMYIGNYSSILNQIVVSFTQMLPNTIKGLQAIASGDWAKVQALSTTQQALDHIKFTLDELHYVKEGYAVYPDTVVEEPRTEIVQLPAETDYLTAKARAKAKYIEDNFFPNERYVDVTGNPDIQYGYLITESGSRIPGGSQQSVVAGHKEIIDNAGYVNELYLVRKFVV